MPAVSVILTSYNQGQWLRQSIDSVLGQTFPDWELLLIDNGSTDDSPAIVESYRSHPRITVTRYDRNTPHTVISNDGIRRARGRYVSFLYSDDYYLPAKLERQVAVLDTLPPEFGVVYSAGYRLLADGQLVPSPCGAHRGKVVRALIVERQFFLPIAPLVRRECLLRYPFNESLFVEGEGIFTKIALRYLFEPLSEPLVVMRDHPGNAGKEIRPNLERNIRGYDDLFGHPDFPPELAALKPRILGETYRLAGWQTIRRERNYQQGRRWLWSAVRCFPRLAADRRVVLGLVLSALPAGLAERGQALLNRVMGTPPPPVARPETPVEGRAPQR
jgi:glycosyltransferase involved in cell wall biosynthesis